MRLNYRELILYISFLIEAKVTYITEGSNTERGVNHPQLGVHDMNNETSLLES